jgi:cytochrome b561
MWRNTSASWGRIARSLHWLIALLILVQVPLGFYMNSVYDALKASGSRDWSELLLISRLHHTNGFLILILVALRLLWRVSNPTPAMPAGLAAWQRFTARATHVFLYALLLTFPLTGWAALSAYEFDFPIYFFGIEHMPRIVPQADGTHAPYEFYAEIHEACWRIGALVLGLHVVIALWHHFVARDEVLRRMLP